MWKKSNFHTLFRIGKNQNSASSFYKIGIMANFRKNWLDLRQYTRVYFMSAAVSSSLVVSQCGKNVNLLSQVTIFLWKFSEINFFTITITVPSNYFATYVLGYFFQIFKWEWIFVFSSLRSCWKADDLFT